MQDNIRINSGNGTDEELYLPPQDLMNDYIPLDGFEEKKKNVREHTHSSSNSISAGSYSSSLSGEFKHGAYSTGSSLSSSQSGSRSSPVQSTSADDEEDVKHGPGNFGSIPAPSQVPIVILPDAKADPFPTPMAAWHNLQHVITEVNDPLLRLEAKKLSDRAEDERTKKAGGATRLWYKTTSFFSWACCGCLPTLCKSTFVLLTAGAVIAAGLFLRRQANIADDYQAPDFHPGDTTDDSIYALGGITSDIYNLVEKVWPLKNLERQGYEAAGILGLVWTVEFFIYRFMQHENEKTRQAGENNQQIQDAQTEVIRKLTEKDKAQAKAINNLTQQIQTLTLELQKERIGSKKKANRIKRLEKAVESLTGSPLPPLDKDLEEKTISSETVSDGKQVGGLDNTADETREGHTSDITSQMLRERAKASNQGSNSHSFVAGGGRGGGAPRPTGTGNNPVALTNTNLNQR